MNGYYNRDSSETFDSDGWLKTGDIVFFDEDYCFYVVDRIKEMLKYKSWHVPPAVIEKVRSYLVLGFSNFSRDEKVGWQYWDIYYLLNRREYAVYWI